MESTETPSDSLLMKDKQRIIKNKDAAVKALCELMDCGDEGCPFKFHQACFNRHQPIPRWIISEIKGSSRTDKMPRSQKDEVRAFHVNCNPEEDSGGTDIQNARIAFTTLKYERMTELEGIPRFALQTSVFCPNPTLKEDEKAMSEHLKAQFHFQPNFGKIKLPKPLEKGYQVPGKEFKTTSMNANQSISVQSFVIFFIEIEC
uniref:CXXC motif containing zinc binding protein n=1 Tax=Caenorhabditis tropicalis TaxID=1561998 RepID=A0A1I7U667_9PELO